MNTSENTIMTTILVITVSVFCGLIFKSHQEYQFDNYKKTLIGRTVKLSKKFCKKHGFNGRYARITLYWPHNAKIQELDITPCLMTKDDAKLRASWLKAVKKVQEENDQKAKDHTIAISPSRNINYQNLAAQYGNTVADQFSMQMGGGYFETPTPREPNYATFEVIEGEYKIMPIGFDFETEKVIRDPDDKEVKKNMKRTPRIFRYALYLALVVLVWDVVIHANDIALYTIHTFIATK